VIIVEVGMFVAMGLYQLANNVKNGTLIKVAKIFMRNRQLICKRGGQVVKKEETESSSSGISTRNPSFISIHTTPTETSSPTTPEKSGIEKLPKYPSKTSPFGTMVDYIEQYYQYLQPLFPLVLPKIQRELFDENNESIVTLFRLHTVFALGARECGQEMDCAYYNSLALKEAKMLLFDQVSKIFINIET